MPSTMKAAVVRAFDRPLEIEERPVPEPGPEQVLVRVMASGVCHTDLHAARGDWPVKPKLPFVPGHEGVGYVAALGPDVSGLKEGDKVGVPWLHRACGMCEYCVSGWETLCSQQQNTGYSVDGGHAEYVVAPAAYVGRLPERAAFADYAPILCAGVTSYKGLKETEVRPGEWVVVVGVGGLGHLAVPYARAMGMNVAAVDVDDDKLRLARDLGAQFTVNAARTEDDPAGALQKAIGGAHGALVTAVSPESFEQAIGMLRARGTCVLVGLPPGSFQTPIFPVVLKRLTVRGSIVGTRKDLQECLDLADTRAIRPTIETRPLDAINDVFDDLAAGRVNGRVVLLPAGA